MIFGKKKEKEPNEGFKILEVHHAATSWHVHVRDYELKYSYVLYSEKAPDKDSIIAAVKDYRAEISRGTEARKLEGEVLK